MMATQNRQTSEEKKKAKNQRGYDIRFRMASQQPSEPSQRKPKQTSFSGRKDQGRRENKNKT
jgi:hypothetical protein